MLRLSRLCGLAVLLAGCSAGGGLIDHRLQLANDTWGYSYTLEIERRRMELRLDLQLDTGAATVLLTDPRGIEQWREDYAGPVGDQVHMEWSGLENGIWHLDVRVQDAHGTIAYRWEGK